MHRRLPLVVCICLAACSAADRRPATVPAVSDVPAGRLSGDVVPLSYALDLTIVPQRERFSGNVEIVVDIRAATDRFYLHARNLDVHESMLQLADGNIVEAAFDSTATAGVARIISPRVLQPQKALLRLAWNAPFGRQLKGLYAVQEGGRDYAFTQFEPISAREAFPCFDEPAFKTPFDITLNVATGDTAITATPEVEQIPLENGLVRHRYATTPPLPTYLIAFAVGPLDVVTAEDIAPTPQRAAPLPLRGVAAAGKGGRLQYALQTTPELLAIQEAYFDIAHPYPKLDIVAVPDFAAGAMENVGAITYRESLLLLDEDSPVQQRRRHALVHAHELAHQWFGNLVTMPWWDDIWLNESFATWMAYKTVAQWDPQHRAELSRLRRLQVAFDEDALATARQIRQPVMDENDIENAFDGITYTKGGAVLRMFERFMVEDSFREAVRYHLRRFPHANADVNDFMQSLSSIGGDEIGQAFSSFLFQPGIPTLDVEVDCGAVATASISQSRYRPIGSGAADSDGWIVPVCLRYGDEHDSFEACQLTGPAPTQVVLRTCPVWLLPNADYAGYFYWSVADYQPLLAAEAQLSPAEQLAVAHSIHAGLQAGRIDIAGAGGLYRQLATSQRPQVALTPRPFIEFSRQYLVDETSAIDAYVQQLYGDVGAALAFDGSHMASLSSDSRRLFLVDAARLLAAAGDQSVRRAALAAAAELVESNEAAVVAPEAGELALQIAAQVGGQALRQQLLGQLRESRDGQQRRDLLRGLAHADEPGFAASMRDLVLTDVIRVNEIRVFLREHVKSRHNRDATWRWLRQNYDALVARLPPRDAGRLPAELVAGFCDERRLKEVSGFLGPRLSQQVGGVRNLAKAIERIELCARRAAVQRPQARAYFSGG